MHTVFITGGEGFVGTHAMEEFARRDYAVVAGVRNRARKLSYERKGRQALVCDVADAINVGRAIASVRPDAVLHLAGPSVPAEAAADPLAAYQAIVTAWANVLDAVRRTVPRARVVMASSCEVYGDTGGSEEPLSEGCPAQPVTTFGSLKLAAESIAHTFYRDYHLNVTIARPFEYVGPCQPARSLMGAIVQRLSDRCGSEGHKCLSIGGLTLRRDFLHVADVAAAYLRLIEDGRPNEVYNVCSGQATTCREVVELMAAALNMEVELTEDSPTTDATCIPCLRGDNSKLRSELRWEPARSLQDAVQELVEYFRQRHPALAPSA